MKSLKKLVIINLFPIVIVLFAAIDAHAHRVTIFAWVDGDTVHTQSKFSGGKKVSNGEIHVFDPDGTLLLKGNTDEKGEFSFKVPKKTSLKIKLVAGMGHQNEWIVAAEEIGVKQPVSYLTSDQSQDLNDVMETKSDTVMASGLTREDVEQAVDRALEKKLKPVVQMLSDLNDPKPGISDIFGGIGYIIGLVGIGAYFKSRKKRDSENP
jgi:nickel transport protein